MFQKRENVSIQTNLKRNPSNFSNLFLLDVNFENLTIEFHVLYILNTYVNFHSNRILFTIQLINYFFYAHNFRSQKLEI